MVAMTPPGTPLTKEKTTAAGRMETTKEQGKMKTNTSPDTSTWRQQLLYIYLTRTYTCGKKSSSRKTAHA